MARPIKDTPVQISILPGGIVAKKYDKDALLLDWRAKTYKTIDLLAHAYKISPTRVKQLIKGMDQDLAELVTKKVEVNQLINAKSDEEIMVIDKNVTFIENLTAQVRHFGNKAITKANELLDVEQTGSGFKAICDGVDKVTITSGINPRFNPNASTTINASLTNNTLTMSLDDVRRELSIIEGRTA